MHPVPNGTEYGIHLRANTPSGGKDWVGTINGHVITTFWGKTGQVNQNAQKLGNQVNLGKIVQEKLAKGYTKIDEYQTNIGWTSSRTGVNIGEPPLPTPPLNDITKTITIEGATDYDF